MSSVRPVLPVRIAVAAATAVLTAVAGSAAPAAAHEAPRPGHRCSMSGAAVVVHGSIYVCTGSTRAPRWDAGRPVARTALTVADPWAKAARKGSMSALFARISNPTDRPIRIIAAMSPAAPALQLHEVVTSDGQSVMQQKAGGFVVPARGSLTLAPGGNHVMFLDLARPLAAGTTVPVTLVTADGGLLTVRALVKVFRGANEEYPGEMTAR